MLRIGKVDPNFYSSNEKTKYVFLDAPINKTSILAACIHHAKPIKEPIKDLVKQILRQRIEKENSYIAPKNVRFGK